MSSLHPSFSIMGSSDADSAITRTVAQSEVSCLPVDLWIVVVKPGVSDDHLCLSKSDDGGDSFGVISNANDYVCLFSDGTHLIQ